VTNYYVYYRVDPARVGALRLRLKIFLMKYKTFGHPRPLDASPRRSGDYMEVYEGVKDEAAFEVVLARESSKLGLERKTERFVCA
jgi:hypothetical protein